MGMPCAGLWTLPNWQQTTCSLHPGGVNVAFVDGSVHWISDYVDINGNFTTSPPKYSIWDRLNASADGQPIPAGAY